MPAAMSLPVFMRLGRAGAPVEIGTIDLPVDGDGQLTFDRVAVARLLRAAADAIEHPAEDDEGATDDAPA